MQCGRKFQQFYWGMQQLLKTKSGVWVCTHGGEENAQIIMNDYKERAIANHLCDNFRLIISIVLITGCRCGCDGGHPISSTVSFASCINFEMCSGFDLLPNEGASLEKIGSILIESGRHTHRLQRWAQIGPLLQLTYG